MTAAARRFTELKNRYRQLIPRRKVSRETWRIIAEAAALETTREIAAIENACLGEQNFTSGENSNFGAMFANKIAVVCP
jgi:hypothetical protein